MSGPPRCRADPTTGWCLAMPSASFRTKPRRRSTTSQPRGRPSLTVDWAPLPWWCHSGRMIHYADNVAGLTADQLQGFFVDWPDLLIFDTHLRLLRGSDAVELATDEETGRVVGFATAITD